jgi:hypothetical protein
MPFSLHQITEHSKFKKKVWHSGKKVGSVVKYRPQHSKAEGLTPAAVSGKNLFKLSSFTIIKPYFISGTFAPSNAEAGKPY